MIGPRSADLARLSATVLADCAFLLTEPVEVDAALHDAVHAVVGFSGATRGHLMLSASPELAVHIAADMLGIESGDADAAAHAAGALAELANVLLGMLVVTLCDPETTFRFGTPHAYVGSPPEVPHGGAVATLASDSGARIQVRWVMEGDAP